MEKLHNGERHLAAKCSGELTLEQYTKVLYIVQAGINSHSLKQHSYVF